LTQDGGVVLHKVEGSNVYVSLRMSDCIFKDMCEAIMKFTMERKCEEDSCRLKWSLKRKQTVFHGS
jgi:hypothetical protein